MMLDKKIREITKSEFQKLEREIDLSTDVELEESGKQVVELNGKYYDCTGVAPEKVVGFLRNSLKNK